MGEVSCSLLPFGARSYSPVIWFVSCCIHEFCTLYRVLKSMLSVHSLLLLSAASGENVL